MRKTSSIAALCLLAVAVFTSGCCCIDPCGGTGRPHRDGEFVPPTINPGLVEIYRGTTSGDVRVGYVINDSSAGVSYWLLASGETPPVMPTATTPPGNLVKWKLVNMNTYTIAQFCAMGGTLGSGARLWQVTGTPMSCD